MEYKQGTVVIGIDVGKSGGFSAIDVKTNKIVDTMSMPTIGKEYDVVAMIEFISQFPSIMCVGIEDVHAVQMAGRSTSFQFGFGKGILVGIVHTMGIAYSLVQAKTWQKTSWHGVTKQKKPNNKVDTKATSLVAASRLFNDQMQYFKASERSKKPHDGIVDATLIAFHLKTMYNQS